MSILSDHLAEKPADATVTLRGVAFGEKSGAMLLFDAPPWGIRKAPSFEVKIPTLFEISLTQRGTTVSSADFSCTKDHPLLLDYGPRASIFGQAPLPDPYRFFLEFQKLVRDQFAIPREPLRYLNWQGRMTPWLAMVYSRSFNLFTGPRVLADAAGELLAAQVAEYIILDEKPLEGGVGVEALVLGDFWAVGAGMGIGL